MLRHLFLFPLLLALLLHYNFFNISLKTGLAAHANDLFTRKRCPSTTNVMIELSEAKLFIFRCKVFYI